ncbi:MAG: hypothetical protein ACI9QL_004205 [Candidatus Omnitrophota bacterium]|jgi:hypothetical protein
MDRSFLADENVIAASRNFVCIRLATYESEEENAVLKSVFSNRGNLENTVFGLMTPDGRTQLVRAGRSPVWAFGGKAGPGIKEQPIESIEKMASTMNTIAKKYPGKGFVGENQVPYLADLRLALNVAACDRQPLLVVFAEDDETRKAMEKKLAPLAWSKSFIGLYQYVASSDTADFKSITGLNADAGFVVIQPDAFGLKGAVMGVAPVDADQAALEDALNLGLTIHQPSTLNYEAHRAQGSREGTKWETATPVTDSASGRRGRR